MRYWRSGDDSIHIVEVAFTDADDAFLQIDLLRLREV